MKKILILLLVFYGLLSIDCAGRVPVEPVKAEYSEQDKIRFEETMGLLGEDTSLSAPEMFVKTALSFLGTPYVGGLLDVGPEALRIETSKTDCVLFVEMCLALTATYRSGERNFERFIKETAQLRYREGITDSYASRLHYTSDWILKAESRNVLREITEEMGGKPVSQEFNFMSTHPESYSQLKENPSLIKEIAAVERALSAEEYYYIPKPELTKHVSDIRNGDIVCFTSTVDGLDIAHLGIAYYKDGALTFIHASSTAGKVIINEAPLAEYTNGVRSQNGIRVLRLTL